jgi:branched-chain amino acid transport system ATP-binding protein
LTLLELKGLSKQFGDLWALKGINFSMREGEIIGLVGPNGSGKTTLFNLISGRHRPTSGGIFFAGREITGLTAHEICHVGISRTFQSSRPFEGMSVLENVVAGRAFGKGFHLRTRPEDLDIARDLLEVVGISHKAESHAADLTLSEQRRLDLARALATRPRLLLLDEVAAGLSPVAVKRAVELVRRVRQRGVTLFIIDHFLNLSLRVSDRLLALDHGEQVAEGVPNEVMRNRDLIRAYLGLRHREDKEDNG